MALRRASQAIRHTGEYMDILFELIRPDLEYMTCGAQCQAMERLLPIVTDELRNVRLSLNNRVNTIVLIPMGFDITGYPLQQQQSQHHKDQHGLILCGQPLGGTPLADHPPCSVPSAARDTHTTTRHKRPSGKQRAIWAFANRWHLPQQETCQPCT